MFSIADIYFGSYWRIEPDKADEAATLLRNALEAEDDLDLSDLLDDLEEKYNAHVSSHDEGTRTVIFGRQLTTITEADNNFSEMALLRVMDLEKGVLNEDVRAEVTKTLEEVPYDLRTHLSSPGFCVAWSTS